MQFHSSYTAHVNSILLLYYDVIHYTRYLINFNDFHPNY